MRYFPLEGTSIEIWKSPEVVLSFSVNTVFYCDNKSVNMTVMSLESIGLRSSFGLTVPEKIKI